MSSDQLRVSEAMPHGGFGGDSEGAACRRKWRASCATVSCLVTSDLGIDCDGPLDRTETTKYSSGPGFALLRECLPE